ncbi:MAG: hypothetical protein ACYCW6_13575 [Candidatus Xenobia bacterium]
MGITSVKEVGMQTPAAPEESRLEALRAQQGECFQALSAELISLLPEGWKAADLSMEIVGDGPLQRMSLLVSTPEGSADMVQPSPALMAQSRRLYLMTVPYGTQQMWQSCQVTVRKSEDGCWSFHGAFRYPEEQPPA